MITAWQQMHLISQVLAILWLAGMITVPIWKWIIGPKAERAAISAGVLLQAGLVISILMPAWGLTRTLLVWLAVSGLGWLSELIGSRTGFPYGPYTYTKELPTSHSAAAPQAPAESCASAPTAAWSKPPPASPFTAPSATAPP